ncbi:retrovirus-related pol polyprotein LINE-1, partial [Tanacetum coccineum]
MGRKLLFSFQRERTGGTRRGKGGLADNYTLNATTRGSAKQKGIKLFGHTMKLWERVIERRLRRETSVFENQFGFMPGRSSVEAIHLIRSLMEKYSERQRDLHMAFLDLEKAYDSITHNEEVDIRIGDKILQPKESFRYLGSMLYKFGRIDEDVSNQIDEVEGGHRKCWPITKALANKVKVAELRMLRWTCGKTLLDMISNGVYRAQLEVETIINKMREGQLRWFGHVRRRPQSAPVRRVKDLVVDGLRKRSRPK